MCRITLPLPRSGDVTTRAPAVRAISALLSEDPLSKTVISAAGSTALMSPTTLRIVRSSSRHGMITVTSNSVAPDSTDGASVRVIAGSFMLETIAACAKRF